MGRVRLRLTGTLEDEVLLTQSLDEKVAEIKACIPELIYGYEEDLLEKVIGQLLEERHLTLATAESCTGGYLAHRITSVSGSSGYFQGSVIAYSNAIKMNLLKVSSATLEKHGAVSEATVIEMVKGTLQLLKTDIAISISGIAGPGGGTADKPVGTIWMAIGNEDVVKTMKIQAGKDRLKNIEYASVYALNMIRQFVIEQYKPVLQS